MDIMIWSGAALSLAGLLALIWCILKVWTARKANLSDDDLRLTVQKLVPLNAGALFLSVIGLMMVITGIFLS